MKNKILPRPLKQIHRNPLNLLKPLIKYACLLGIFLFNTGHLEAQSASAFLNTMQAYYDPCTDKIVVKYDHDAFNDISNNPFNLNAIRVGIEYLIPGLASAIFYPVGYVVNQNGAFAWTGSSWPSPWPSPINTNHCGTTSMYYATQNGGSFSCDNDADNIIAVSFPIPNVGGLTPPYQVELSFGTVAINVIGGYMSIDFPGNQRISKSIYPYGNISAPSSLSTQAVDCNSVKLSWSNTGTHCGSSSNIQIIRSGTSVATISGTSTTYTDTSAPTGTHNYYINRIASGKSSGASISGSTKLGPADSPSSLNASESNCEGIVELSWSWNFTDFLGFTIERSTTEDFAVIDETFDINEKDLRSYEDETNIQRNIDYFYRIAAYNDCGPSPFSSVVQGFAPDKPTVATNVTANIVGNEVHVNWEDNSLEDKFYLRRLLLGGGFDEYEFEAGTTSFEDNTVTNCQTYFYKVKAENECGSSISQQSAGVKLIPDLTQVIQQGNLFASKGYRPGEVRLEWTSEDAERLDYFKIYRKVYNSDEDSILIATLPANTNIYSDYDAEANTILEYTIIGQGSCENEFIYTMSDQEVGFRSPSGIVSGNINYEGGIAVEGVKVVASSVDGASGHSLGFNGTDQYAQIPHDNLHAPTGGFTVGVWAHPLALDQNMTLLHKSNGSNGFGIRYLQSSNEVEFWTHINGSEQNLKSTAPFLANQYSHIGGSYDGEWLKLFVNGVPKDSVNVMGLLTPSTANLYLGGNSPDGYFNGSLDELVLLDYGRNNLEMEQDHARTLANSENGLIGYWRFDEGTGPFLFDATEISPNVFNEAHGARLFATWSNTIPTASQLGVVGYTDKNGSYIIENVRYEGNGENFTIVPIKGVHQFDPSQRILFIGDGAVVHNNTDFTDISSFKVTGSVRYKGTTCFAKEVLVKIDGEVVVKDGLPVLTDDNGLFEIQVPIGKHYITVEKTLHDFEVGRWPAEGTYDFQDVVSGIEFIDSTLITIVGRVVGGKTESDKPIGFGKSVNNIGQATITFKSQQGNGCSEQTITTDAQTGEYMVKLPPLKYIVDELSIASNPIIDFGVLDLVNLSNPLPLQVETNTVYANGTSEVVSVDTARYHLQNDYIYRTQPELQVFNEDKTGAFTGEKELTYTDENDTEFILDIVAHPFHNPVFKQAGEYTMAIEAFEQYANFDSGSEVVYKDPLKEGTLLIDNKLALKQSVSFPVQDGDTLYTFQAGNPNPLPNNSIPEYSYTKTLEVLLQVGSFQTKWEPVTNPPTGGDNIFRGYVFGSRSIGNSFVTEGPQIVDMVLRDPPGSGSSAFFEKEQSISFSQSWSLAGSKSSSVSKKIDLGADFSTGVGFTVETDAENAFTSTVNIEKKINGSGEYVETWQSSQKISTRGDAELVGASSDIYMGKSMNIIFGLAEKFSIVPDSLCNYPGVDCTNFASNGYKIAKRESFWVVPNGFGTEFIYDQNHIENYLIPDLTNLRNYYLSNSSSHTSHVSIDHDLYGANNDDPRWKDEPNGYVTSDDGGVFAQEGSPFYSYTNIGDLDGMSYTYTGGNPNEDSVRWYNQQIRLWEQAIYFNEKDKVISLNDVDENISFNGGVTVEKSKGFNFTTEHKLGFEFNISKEAELEMGGKIGGVGVTATGKIAVGISVGAGLGLTTDNTTTFGYELSDDLGDFFSVDVAKSDRGWGPVFKTRAGESMCPHEEEIVTKFYQPGTTLSERTLQREVPVLEISPSIMVNVPADEMASFNLSIGNNSETGDQQVFKLQVLEDTNPFGAIIRVDGEDPNREFAVPPNGAFNKVLTVERGPAVYEYDSIQVILHSLCQFQNATSQEKDLADTITFSVHYLPVCTEVELIEPEDQWVVNNGFNDTLPIIIGGYDINYPDFKKVRFQYRPISDPDWIGLETYYRNEADKPTPEALSIPQNQPYITYDWDVSQITDANYYVRAVTECALADESSDNYVGIIDRVNPHPFGTPSPGDGILSPNDDILIQFNEPIEAGALTIQNFDIRGVLNGAELTHGTSVYFNGTDSKMTIPEGINLTAGSFSVEMWMRRGGANGEECVFSQGVNTGQAIFAGFNSNNQLTMTIAGETVNTVSTITDTDWHHVVYSYDALLNVIEIFVDSYVEVTETVYPQYEGTGRIAVGHSLAGAPRHFDGNIHELRLWGKARDEADIAARRFVLLTGREAGILGVWQMDEAMGTDTEERIRERHATLENTTWTVEPFGRSYAFNGSDYLSTPAGTLSYNNETDLTIEFWFNSTNGNNINFLSNGKGDGSDNLTSWSIGTDANGKIFVTNQDNSFEAVTDNFFDGQWHHFALVVNRLSDISAFIDGNLQNTLDSDDWGGFGGAKLFVGCRGWSDFNQNYQDRHFTGSMDEVRLWNTSRKQEQIVRDMTNKQKGDELGLEAYWAFEDYEQEAGVNVLIETLNDLSQHSNHLTANGGAYDTQTPPIRLPRPVQKVNFIYSVNNDKIILTPTDPPALIENVTLDITVKDVFDLQGNKMQSPATWIAYVDKNQTVWEEQQLYFEKPLGEPLSFTTKILNQGGELKSFSIDNLPNWLTSSPRVGAVPPNSYLNVTFTVDPSLNIGEYTQDLQLNTDFGFSEILVLELKVSQAPPTWNVTPADYAFTMNVVGQVKQGEIFSTDDEDILYAVVNDEIRGKAQLQYVEAYDKFLAFMDIYSNNVGSETVEFRFWDASQGRVYVNITPQLDFASDTYIGTPSAPQIFEAPAEIYQTIPISTGWNWISFNLQSSNASNINKMLETLSASTGDVIKGFRFFDQYEESFNSWGGGLSNSGGIQNDELYKLQISGDNDLIYTGAVIDPTSQPIDIEEGWNWISYIGLRNLSVNAALTTFTATDGDLIKGQFAFAIYDHNLGWVGSLTHLEPNQGYMLNAANAGTVIFPASGVGGGKTADSTPSTLAFSEHWEIDRHSYPSNMTIIGQVEWCDLPNITDDLRVGAFDGEECRGIGKLWYDNETEQYFTYLTVYGDNKPQDLTLKLVHEETGIELEIEEGLFYEQDGIITNGYYKTTSELACNKLLDNLPQDGYFSQVKPVPFDSELEIEFTLEESSDVEVIVYDMAGKPIATLLKEQKGRGNWTVNWDAADYPLGMYVVLVRTPQFTHTHKALKSN
ncbi:MAG: LamG domain-containing protein [Chitinophagales bacterium]